MGIFDWLRRSPPDQTIQGELKRLAPTLFPGGQDEIMSAGRKISALLDSRIPPESASKLYASTKYLAHTASDKSKERVVAYIERQGMGRIGNDDASAIYDRFISPTTSGGQSTSPSLATGSVQATPKRVAATLGSQECPVVIEPPADLGSLRQILRKSLRGTKYAELAQADEVVDGMLAEEVKMQHLEQMLGKQMGTWQCGEREYLDGAIQSQQIIFTDGRPPSILFFDFSRFGCSSGWGSSG